MDARPILLCCPGPEGEPGPRGPRGPQGPPGQLAAAYYHGWQTGTLANSALYGGLDLTQRRFTQDAFSPAGERVVVLRPGVYLVQFTLQVPRSVTLDTTVALQRNGVSLPDMTVVIDHPAGASGVYTAQGILEIGALDIFRLSSSRVISYRGAGTLASWQFILLEPAAET